MTKFKPLKLRSETGIALVETVLLLVIVSAIVGVGLYVVKQHQAASDTLSSSSSLTTSKGAAGTTDGIDQITQQDAQAETKADESADKATQQSSTSANGAIGNVEGAYNESGL